MSAADWAKAARAEFKDWTRFADGYQACPACGCLLHPMYAEVHAGACSEIRRMMAPNESESSGTQEPE